MNSVGMLSHTLKFCESVGNLCLPIPVCRADTVEEWTARLVEFLGLGLKVISRTKAVFHEHESIYLVYFCENLLIRRVEKVRAEHHVLA